MSRVVQIAKCIDIIIIDDNTLEFKFDKDINLEDHEMIIITTTTSAHILAFRFKKLLSISSLIDSRIRKPKFDTLYLNKYVLLRCNYRIVTMQEIEEALWQDLGNLENPSLEEINFYIKALNEYST